MVNLVIVSHSSRLGEGVGELARQMLMSDSCKIAIAAGIDDPQNPIGTDAVKVMEAIESVADADHVLVMMDMGSALLSAETALELLAPKIAAKVRLCAAPLVEGTLAATVSAASGADIDKVIFDAMHALEAKREQLGLPSSDTEISDTCPAYDEEARSLAVVIKNRNGLHVRPASRLVYTLSTFNADMLLEKNPNMILISDEVGYGVVPVDAFDRDYRESVGRVCTQLAAKCSKVTRVVCGIGTVIKGE